MNKVHEPKIHALPRNKPTYCSFCLGRIGHLTTLSEEKKEVLVMLNKCKTAAKIKIQQKIEILLEK